MKLLIKGGYIAAPGYDPTMPMDILIDDGVISKVEENVSSDGASVIRATGLYILPGLIDMHASLCDPGMESVENILTGSLSAAKGGFTSITCEPDTIPAIDNKTVVEYVDSKSRENAIVNLFAYGSMTRDCAGKEMADIGEMSRAGIVAVSDGDQTVEDTFLLRNIFLYANMFHLPVITHCEDTHLSEGGVMNDGFFSTTLGLRGIPREAEETVLARNLVIAEHTGCHLHIAQVSTRGSVQLIREAKKRGVKVTCETCPQYFILTEEALSGYNTLAKMNPPLRTQKDVEAIRQGLKDGTIDVITSGHRPVHQEEKERDIVNAGWGISALETAFPLSATYLVKTGILTLTELAEKMSVIPSKILSLSDKGWIRPGMDGDLTIVDMNRIEKIDAATFRSKAKFSPFDGMDVTGVIKYTIVGGRLPLQER
ncbi:MAG: dihydroorotase [Clostridiales bacterium]|nr:dihydroorotase [Clostridiales bacterium]